METVTFECETYLSIELLQNLSDCSIDETKNGLNFKIILTYYNLQEIINQWKLG